MTDFAILDMRVHLLASKNRRYRESIHEYFTTFAAFLQDNGLTNRQLLVRGEALPEDFQIKKSDLTDEGFEFVKRSLQKWTSRLEGGAPIDDVGFLQEELSRLRENSAENG